MHSEFHIEYFIQYTKLVYVSLFILKTSMERTDICLNNGPDFILAHLDVNFLHGQLMEMSYVQREEIWHLGPE